MHNNNRLAAGFVRVGKDLYYFDRNNGFKANRDGRFDIGVKSYYAQENGKLHIGRVEIDEELYIFNNNGEMYKNGYFQIDRKWYNIDPTGIVLRGAEGNFRHLSTEAYYNENGELSVGFTTIGGKHYFYDGNGKRLNGFRTHNKELYYFGEEDKSAFTERFFNVGNNTYYVDVDGKIAKGWKTIGYDTYMFNTANGVMFKNGNFRINNKTYLFDAEGRLHKSVAVFDGDPFYQEDGSLASGLFKAFGEYYFMGAKNTLYKNGWLNVGKDRYYFTETGKALRNVRKEIQGKEYHFTEEGKLLRGVHKFKGTYFIADGNGALYSGDENKVTIIQGKEYRIAFNGSIHLGLAEISNEQYKIFDLTGARIPKGFTIYTPVDSTEKQYYFFSNNGIKEYGWKTVAGKKYYFAHDNMGMAYLDELVEIEGNKYYFNDKAMMQIGWHTIDGEKYYFGSTGAAYNNGIFKIDNKFFYFDEYSRLRGAEVDGKILTIEGELGNGWVVQEGMIRYAKNNQFLSGWQDIEGKRYYFNPMNANIAATGLQEIDGASYYFSHSDKGAARTGWVRSNYAYDGDDFMRYFSPSDYTMAKGWQDIEGKRYYFDPSFMYGAATGMRNIGGDHYYFNDEGAVQSGWIESTDDNGITGKRYYSPDDYKRLTGWQKIDGTWYYFDDFSGIYFEDMGHEGPPIMPAPSPGNFTGEIDGLSVGLGNPDGLSVLDENSNLTAQETPEESLLGGNGNEEETSVGQDNGTAPETTTEPVNEEGEGTEGTEEAQNSESENSQNAETPAAEESVQKYTVTLQIDSDEKQEIKVQAGKKLRKPTDPEKTGYSFVHWYILVEEGTETKEVVFDFSQEITEDITIYAKWKEVEPGTTEPDTQSPVAPENPAGGADANAEPTQEPTAEPAPVATPEPAPAPAPAESAPESQPEPAPVQDGEEG